MLDGKNRPGGLSGLARAVSLASASILFVSTASAQRSTLVDRYCVGCHNQKLKTGGISLDSLDLGKIGQDAGVWERVLRKVRAGQMPPAGLPRPDAATTAAFVRGLEESLDKAAATNPNPGAPMPHRLNRIEYSNAIRDLLALDIKPGAALPEDDSGNGFDNMADLLSMSPALLERYMSTSRRVSRLAVGDLKIPPAEEQYGNSKGAKKEGNVDDLPFDARGGLAVQHYFPLDAEYVVKIGMAGAGEDAVSPYELRLPVKAGLHSVVATFLRESARPESAAPPAGRRGGAAIGVGGGANNPPALMDLRLDGAKLKRFEVPQRGGAPDANTLSIAGPFNVTGRGDTPSREKIFVCRPSSAKDEEPCARAILSNLTRNAFRRPVTDADLRPLLAFYVDGREGADFDSGIQNALEAMLMSPDFLFRVERDPRGSAPGSVYWISDHELASRLSFFLWSSVPDGELLKLADQGKLKDPAVVKAQLARMMDDPKSDALIKNFGGQWLFLRTLQNSKPDPDIFSGFDENLRQAFREETELFLTSIFREDRSVLDLLEANYTFLNQRLAEHYGIPGVYGPHFRKVVLTDANRGGLLGQGSILTVTSYPNRTSVVQRGKWILENLLGTPPPPPPADVPELQPKAKDGRQLTLRQAMEQHRANAICASCHGRMDPIGFALENFDGVGSWRTEDAGGTIDATGKLPDGTQFSGPAGLRKLLLTGHRDEFVQTATEKLLTYALGRGLEPYDQPTVRSIMRKAARDNYRISALVTAVVESAPFQMRRASDR